MFKKLKAWLNSHPVETSDVVSVSIVRRGPDGKLHLFTLKDEAASRWGYLLSTTRGSDPRYNELLPYWERTKL